MQMDPKHNTQNTLPCFLGAHSKLKLGSSWGLTFSLVQTTSAPRRAWRKVKEPVTATVDSSETENLVTPAPSHPEGGQACTCTHTYMHAAPRMCTLDPCHTHTHTHPQVPLTHAQVHGYPAPLTDKPNRYVPMCVQIHRHTLS